MANSSTSVVTRKPVRLSYVNLFQPRKNDDGSEGKYGCTLLVPKTDKDTKAAIDAAIDAARKLAATRGIKNAANLKSPVHDGDGEKPNGGKYGPECAGMWVISSSTKNRPGIVSKNLQPIIDTTEIYSGVWANVDINFYAYAMSGNSGVACGLNNIQKIRDDEALGGRDRAENVFAPVEDDDDDLGL